MTLKYLVRKIVFYVVALWAAITLNFALPRMMPGNPMLVLVAKFKGQINPHALSSYAQLFGLDQHTSILTQYFQYIGQVFHGNLGYSFGLYPETVTQVLMQSLPWTLFLLGTSTVISFVIGTLLGIVSAWRRGSVLDSVAPTVFTLLGAFPYFWLALVALYFLAFRLRWFPIGHAYSDTVMGWSWANLPDILYHAILPALTIVVTSIGGWLLGMRNNMITTLSEEYVKVAKAKGLANTRVMLRYAARNAILPNITSFALSLGFILSGALLTEIVFSYPGLGYELFQAVGNEDYPMMQGALLLIAIGVLVANFLADLVYVRLDPRARRAQ
ncbi:ABC transporter permease [Alicyclobacillus kakegawensis]|uniref:ABC transporter permease n=1 Tax=Alicyclobacillus kakegawensis TaxID=392012 RepID=UPI000AE977C4|nr:ABC transporter permease [Alicyclobacillus kakegawensis]